MAPLFGAEQVELPGIEPTLWLVALLDDGPAEAPEVVQPGGDQLLLGPNQMLLSEAEPDPRQLSLLPDPPPWDRPAPRLRRARTRARRILPAETLAGQLPLFNS
jgi:hypothetical protein